MPTAGTKFILSVDCCQANVIPDDDDVYPVNVRVTEPEAVQNPETEGRLPAVGVELHGKNVVVKHRKSSPVPVKALVVLLPGTVKALAPEVALTTVHGPLVAAPVAISNAGLSAKSPSSAP